MVRPEIFFQSHLKTFLPTFRTSGRPTGAGSLRQQNILTARHAMMTSNHVLRSSIKKNSIKIKHSLHDAKTGLFFAHLSTVFSINLFLASYLYLLKTKPKNDSIHIFYGSEIIENF